MLKSNFCLLDTSKLDASWTQVGHQPTCVYSNSAPRNQLARCAWHQVGRKLQNIAVYLGNCRTKCQQDIVYDLSEY